MPAVNGTVIQELLRVSARRHGMKWIVSKNWCRESAHHMIKKYFKINTIQIRQVYNQIDARIILETPRSTLI